MAMPAAISSGTLIISLCLQNILAQQCLNNGQKTFAGGPQQPLPKTACGLNQAAQNSGPNFNSPQQANLQQTNFQQQSNIQQAPFIQQAGNLQPQSNLQQASSQQPVNSITNSQLQQQQNQNLPTSICSALYNIRQPSPNQGSHTANPPQQTSFCGSQQNIEQISSQSQLQNQPSPTFTISNPVISKPQNVNQASSVSTPFPEYPQYLPTFALQAVPSNNVLSQQNQQVLTPPAQNYYTNSQNQGYSNQNPLISNSVPSQQPSIVQSPIVLVPGGQTNTPQSQPILLTLQPPQISLVQNQPNPPTSQLSQSQPVIYALQTQPSVTAHNHNQQMLSRQPQEGNNAPMDKQSLLYYIMSQLQNPQENNNPLASILPAMLNTKPEKSFSMKALLPLIFNMLNDKRNGCVCPHCGCNNNNNQNTNEPIINSGYSNQKQHSKLEPVGKVLSKANENVETGMKSTSKTIEKTKIKDAAITNNSAEISEEEDEEEESEEYYDDE